MYSTGITCTMYITYGVSLVNSYQGIVEKSRWYIRIWDDRTDGHGQNSLKCSWSSYIPNLLMYLWYILFSLFCRSEIFVSDVICEERCSHLMTLWYQFLWRDTPADIFVMHTGIQNGLCKSACLEKVIHAYLPEFLYDEL